MISTLLWVLLAGAGPHSGRSATLFRIVQDNPHDLRLFAEGRGFIEPFRDLALTSGDGISVLAPDFLGAYVFDEPAGPDYIVVGGIRRGTYFFAVTTSRDGGKHWVGAARVDLNKDLAYCSSGFVGDALHVTFKRPGELVDFHSDDGGASWSEPTRTRVEHRDGPDVIGGPCDETLPSFDDRPYTR